MSYFYVSCPDGYVKCPKCGAGPMVCRENYTTGEDFLGCINYPNCNGSRNISEANGKSFSVHQSTHGECNRCGSYSSDLSAMRLCPSCNEWFEEQ